MADTVQFNLEKDNGIKLIDSYADGCVKIDGLEYRESLLLFPDRIVEQWPVHNVNAVDISVLEIAIDAKPEILLLGTGDRQILPPRDLMKSLAVRNRSIDAMGNGAACRTYNVLASEFRRVALALIL